MIFSGTNAEKLGFNFGPGAMRRGRPRQHRRRDAGCGSTSGTCSVLPPDQHDKATFGNPTKPVLAEDMACLTEIGWPSLAADLGVSAVDDAVSMVRNEQWHHHRQCLRLNPPRRSSPTSATASLEPPRGTSPTSTASAMISSNRSWCCHRFWPAPLVEAGWSKQQTKEALFEHARIPASTFENFIGRWSNLTAGRRSLAELAQRRFDPQSVRPVRRPRSLGPDRHPTRADH